MNIEELKRLADRLGLPTENGNRLHDLSFWLDSPPAVPEMTDDALKEILNAAQIVGYDDPLHIVRGFAMRVLQKWGNQEGMHKAFLDAVKPAAVLELIRQRDELLIAAKDAHQVLRDWVGYIPSSTIQEDLDMLGIAIANAEAP